MKKKEEEEERGRTRNDATAKPADATLTTGT
jgi:hypothetical protein